MPFFFSFEALKQALALVPGLGSAIEQYGKDDYKPLRAVVSEMQTELAGGIEELRQELDKTRALLKDEGFDMEKTLTENREMIGGFDLIKSFRFNRRQDKVEAIKRKLSGSLDDFTRILMCTGKLSGMDECYDLMDSIRRNLDDYDGKRVGEMIDAYRGMLDNWAKRLL
jgi:hypothetical protein